MRKQTLYVTLPICAAIIVAGAWLSNAGPLTPPPGPVTETGRFGPRMEISELNTPGDSSTLFRIAQPGSYYLAANITGVAGKHGIEIDADNVTLDLNGFSLLGVTGSGDGITGASFPSMRSDITIYNGAISDWGGSGIYFELAFNTRIEDVRASRNTQSGISLDVGSGSVITHCVARYNGFSGIDAGSGATIAHCSATANTGDGIVLGNGSTISNCTAYENEGDGIEVGAGCHVTQNQCHENGNGAADGAGIRVAGTRCRIEANNVTLNDRGIDVDGTDNIIVKNTAGGNTNNYTFPLGVLNRVGEIVDATGIIVIDDGNSSSWANFEY